MDPVDAGHAVLALLAIVVATSLWSWSRDGATLGPLACLAGAGAAALVAALAPPEVSGDTGRTILTVLAGLVAVAGGGPVTTWVFALVDGQEGSRRIADAAQRLRGGAWIGGLERAAVYAVLLAGWPEGIAVVLAVKGFGRYPELKTADGGAAERFIVGTFTSTLWASACAGIVALAA